MASHSPNSTTANNRAARKKGLKPRANSANFAGRLVGLSGEDISVWEWKLGLAVAPAGCRWQARRPGSGGSGASPLECSGGQEVVKNAIDGDASCAANIVGPARDPRCRRPGVVRAESAGSDQPVLQAPGRRMPATLHALFL